MGHAHEEPVYQAGRRRRQRLSLRRAEAAQAQLVSMRGGRHRIHTKGAVASQPTADNSTVEGRAKNRRVAIALVGTRAKP